MGMDAPRARTPAFPETVNAEVSTVTPQCPEPSLRLSWHEPLPLPRCRQSRRPAASWDFARSYVSEELGFRRLKGAPGKKSLLLEFNHSLFFWYIGEEGSEHPFQLLNPEALFELFFCLTKSQTGC